MPFYIVWELGPGPMHHFIICTGAAGRIGGASEILITTVPPPSPDDQRANGEWRSVVIGDTLVLEAAKAVVLTTERTP